MIAAFDILADEALHPSLMLQVGTQELYSLGGIDKLYAESLAFLHHIGKELLLAGNKGHHRGIGGVELVFTIILRGRGIVHEHEIYLVPFKGGVGFFQKMHGGSGIKHPVKVPAAVFRPYIPSPLVGATGFFPLVSFPHSPLHGVRRIVPCGDAPIIYAFIISFALVSCGYTFS